MKQYPGAGNKGRAHTLGPKRQEERKRGHSKYLERLTEERTASQELRPLEAGCGRPLQAAQPRSRGNAASSSLAFRRLILCSSLLDRSNWKREDEKTQGGQKTEPDGKSGSRWEFPMGYDARSRLVGISNLLIPQKNSRFPFPCPKPPPVPVLPILKKTSPVTQGARPSDLAAALIPLPPRSPKLQVPRQVLQINFPNLSCVSCPHLGRCLFW